MITYLTVSVSESDVETIDDTDSKFLKKIDNVMHAALTLMLGGNFVQLKITNLPMKEQS